MGTVVVCVVVYRLVVVIGTSTVVRTVVIVLTSLVVVESTMVVAVEALVISRVVVTSEDAVDVVWNVTSVSVVRLITVWCSKVSIPRRQEVIGGKYRSGRLYSRRTDGDRWTSQI